MKIMMKILKAAWVGVKCVVGFTIPFALAAVIGWGAYSFGYSEGGRAVKRYQEPVSYRDEISRKEAAKAYWAWMKEHGLLKGTEDERTWINRAND
jgi:hypothetical protein